MPDAPTDLYVQAFLASCAARGDVLLAEELGPGIHGTSTSSPGPAARLLITDDRAIAWLRSAAPTIASGTINVLAPASRCTEHLAGNPLWEPSVLTAMVRHDRAVEPHALPGGLRLRRVRRRPDDPPADVPLESAVACAAAADARILGAVEPFTASMRAPHPGLHLLAATDPQGTVRGTSGFATHGAYADLLFVNADPDWQRLGIGRAMTAAALLHAHAAGARVVRTDATAAGLPIYRGLGFDTVSTKTRFARIR